MAVGKAKSKKIAKKATKKKTAKKAAKKTTQKKLSAKTRSTQNKAKVAEKKPATKDTGKMLKKTAQKPLAKDAASKNKVEVVGKVSKVLTKKSLQADDGPKNLKKAQGAEVDSLLLLTKAGKKWKTLFERSKKVKAPVYKMSQQYEAKTPIQHSVLGWGYILSNQNDRLEVLFKDGVKTLISNFKR